MEFVEKVGKTITNEIITRWVKNYVSFCFYTVELLYILRWNKVEICSIVDQMKMLNGESTFQDWALTLSYYSSIMFL